MKRGGLLLITRGVTTLIRSPGPVIIGLATSAFFLIVYNAGIGGVGALSAASFGAGGYFAFLFPLGTVSLAMGSSTGAGQSLHADIGSGYFRRLYLSPTPRWAFAASPVIADAVGTALATCLLLGVGAAMNLPLRFGPLSAVGIVGISTLWGMALSGISGGIMLRTGKPSGARVVTNAIFPLIFLSTTFLPRELIASRWLATVSRINPITYLLEGQRFLLAGTGDYRQFVIGATVASALALFGVAFAMAGAKRILV